MIPSDKMWMLISFGAFLLLVVILGLICVSCEKMPFDYINEATGMRPDNPIEQITEEVIELETGIDIDLSRENP